MRILYADYNMLSKTDIMEAFRELGHEVEEQNAEIPEKALFALVEDGGFDLVFSSNFHPDLARACEKSKVRYMSWIYDSPQVLTYDRSICSEYSYAFHFDSAEAENLKARGVKNIWYMPLGVNPERLSKIDVSDRDRELFSSDVSIVASLYNEEHNLYDRLCERLDDYSKGYLDAILMAQKNLFGGNLIDAILRDHPELIRVMYKAMPYPLAEGSLADLAYVYANYFLCRKVAAMQRIEMISDLSKRFDMKVYTGGDLSAYPHVKCMGTVDYLTDMNKVFRCSKINLNITLPSIHTGIPLRALDIMGAGGFLLSNYQSDFDALFTPGEDYASFSSMDDAYYTIEYYLEHEDERYAVQKNGTEKVTQGLSFEELLRGMLDIVFS